MRIPLRVALLRTALPFACTLAVLTGVAPVAAGQSPTATGSATTAGVRLRAVGADAARGRAEAIVVEQGALVHTALIRPLDPSGQVHAAGNPSAQATFVLDALEKVLKSAGTALEHVARVNVYVADASVATAIEPVITKRFAGRGTPAMTLVESRMPVAGTLVAMDAIAATTASSPTAMRIAVTGLTPIPDGGSHVAVQPAGPFVIVSGRAAPGDFEAAVKATVEQLRGDLKTAGLGLDHVVHVKSFLGDMARAEQLQQLVAQAFGGTAPPQVVTEWRDSSLPVEIELVATAPGATGTERVTFVEPISSRYSRVARVFEGRPVFVAGLTGTSAEPATQVREIFEQLRRIVADTGSDMRHVAKATYYVSDKVADQEINTVRPSIYDAARPPAASKISVTGTGRAGKATVIDFIAVTTR